MKEPSSRTKIWGPTFFCACLCLIKLFVPGRTGDVGFYIFLPMCFFLAASAQLSLCERIEIAERALREAADQEGG